MVTTLRDYGGDSGAKRIAQYITRLLIQQDDEGKAFLAAIERKEAERVLMKSLKGKQTIKRA